MNNMRRTFRLNIGERIQVQIILNPFKSQIINWLNLLTNSTDTVYDGKIPTLQEIEMLCDLIINGETLFPLKLEAIEWFNILTDTSDTDYNGFSPLISDIETSLDLINEEII